MSTDSVHCVVHPLLCIIVKWQPHLLVVVTQCWYYPCDRSVTPCTNTVHSHEERAVFCVLSDIGAHLGVPPVPQHLALSAAMSSKLVCCDMGMFVWCAKQVVYLYCMCVTLCLLSLQGGGKRPKVST